MPLARIVCQSPDAALPLTQRLSALGYEVEVVGSAAGQERACDLLLEVDDCAPAEALARAEAFANANVDGQVLVAPGLLQPEAMPAAPGLFRRIAQSLRDVFAREPKSQSGAERYQQLHLEPEAPAIPAPEAAAPAEVPVVTAQPFIPETRGRSEAEQEAFRHAEELARRAEEQKRREEEWAAREAEIMRRNREAEAEVLRMAHELEKRNAQPATPTVDNREQPPSVEPVEIQEPVQEEYQPEEEPVLPAELAPASDRTQVDAPVADTPVPQAPPLPSTPELQPASAAGPAPARKRRMRPRGLVSPRKLTPRSMRGREWKIAIVSACVFTVLLIGAWSLVTEPKPASPLSSQQIVEGSKMQQEVPFGPVKLTNRPSKASPVVAARPAPRPVKATVKRRIKRRAENKRHSQPADDTVVVRQFRRTPPSATATEANSRVKHYSDSN